MSLLLGDHVAEVDADAKLDPFVGRDRCIAFGHAALQFHRAAHRIHDARKFRQQAVAGVFDHAAAMLGNLRIYQLGEVRPEPLVRAFLIRPHQARIARHIGG